MANIKQTDLLEFLVDKFNANSFGIPFRMGTYDGDNENGITIYAPTRDNNGVFDKKYVFNENTYQTETNTFVVMGGNISNGEYTALPNIQLVAYDVQLEFLVYMDSPISELIRLAIEEVRDNLIGAFHTLAINEVDLTNQAVDAPLITSYLKLATTADSINFGDYFDIKGKRYMVYSLTTTMTVSKNVEMGNQFEWGIGGFKSNQWVETTELYWDSNGEVSGDYDIDVKPATTYNIATVLPLPTVTPLNTASRISKAPNPATSVAMDLVYSPLTGLRTLQEAPGETDFGLTNEIIFAFEVSTGTPQFWQMTGYSGGIYTWVAIGNADGFTYPTTGFNIDDIYYHSGRSKFYKAEFNGYNTTLYEIDTLYDYYKVVEVPNVSTFTVVTPLKVSFGATNEVESFQVLNSLSVATQDRAREVHSYVKSRGFDITMTFLFDTKISIIRQLFRECFEKQETPTIYSIQMRIKELQSNGSYTFPSDLQFTRRVIVGQAVPSDIVIGEPVVFSVGFNVSAK